MATCAPRISPLLLEALVRLDDRAVPIAETCRRIGEVADRLGLTRPSYQRIRVLVHQARRVGRVAPSVASILVDIALRVRPPGALLDHVSGVGYWPYDESAGL